MHIKYTLTNNTIEIIHEGKAHSIAKGSPNFLPLRDALLNEDWDAVPGNLTVTKSIESWAKGKFKTDGSHISYDGKPLPSDLNQRIIAMVGKGEDPTIFFNFWERLQKNPSFRSVNQLWGFLQHENIPLTPEGKFLAYKSVRRDYKDHHSGQFDNSPGRVNKMPRNEISDDPNLACHDGFHVGALSYAQTFHSSEGSRLVVVEVDPENVVCVPYDERERKMRVCEYKVLGNYGDALPSTSFVEDKYEDGPEDELEDEAEEGAEDLPVVEGTPISSVGGTKSSTAISMSTDTVVEKSKKPRKGWAKFDKMDTKTLLNQTIDDLRKYAGKGLEIVGASKIPGGKAALVSAILKTRD